MSGRAVAFFAMPEEGHFRRLRPLISGLAGRGLDVHVYTHHRFRAHVERAGAAFVDLFARYPLERADATSIPIPCRFVSFAGRYADEIVRDVEELGPALIVYDTFSVIARVVGTALGVPYVNVCAGHNMGPARVEALVREYPRVEVSADCRRAVRTLRERYGLEDASPFSFASGLSPFLNVYCEPAVYLEDAERRVFEPVAFYGSLPPVDEGEPGPAGKSWFAGDTASLNVYVSFGTVVWRYWAPEALNALESISGFLRATANVSAVIGLGGAELDADSVRALSGPNVSVTTFVDQWQVLREADVFVTHHGLSSTHEAIFHGVPMISYPFFADQPGLAERCRAFGLAIPLGEPPYGRLTVEDVESAFGEFLRRRESLHASLAEARGWELEAIAGRSSVHARIAGLIDQTARPAA